MMKWFFSFFIMISFSFASTENVERRREQIIKIINEELDEVMRLSERGGNRDPNLLLRAAELNLEKARLYRERENQDFLKLPINKRGKINKNQIYKISSRYFAKANDICKRIISHHKSFSKIGEVYYILGYNLKEEGKEKMAENYLGQASKKSKNQKIRVKSQLTMADMNFNKRNFNRARKLYEQSLSSYSDKWWTKDSFNLAWSYYHLNRYQDAINKMLEVYKKSKDPKFIDMSDQVERDLGIFYATAGKIDEGINFYKKIGVNFSQRLYGIALNLKSSGKFSDAEKVLNAALKNEQNEREKNASYILLLEIYQKAGVYSKHQVISELVLTQFKKNNLDAEQIKTFKFQLESIAALLQRQVISKTYKRLKKQRNAKAIQAIRYFEILAEVDSKRYDEFMFLKGETAFAVGQYYDAYKAYMKTFDASVKYKLGKFKNKSMDNMLVTLAKFSKRYDLNIEVYEKFLENYHNDKRLKAIYVRLFNNYMSIENYQKAKYTLDRYKERFPRDDSQEVMIAKLMDISRSKGDNSTVRIWIKDIENGKYFVSKKYMNKLQELLTTMQMEDVQKDLKSGKKASALAGYHEVLKDKYSTKRSKINAKYNLAALYYELGDVENSYKWSIAALDEMEDRDAAKFSSSFVTISNFLFMSLELKKAAHLSEKLLLKSCHKNLKIRETVFKNAGYMHLADRSVSGAERVRIIGEKCHINKRQITELDYEIMRESFLTKDYNRFEKYAAIVDRDPSYVGKMVDEYLKLSAVFQQYNNTEKWKKYFNLAKMRFNQARKKKMLISIKSINYFSSLEVKKMLVTEEKLKRIVLEYPEAKFQKLVEYGIGLLDKLVEQANDVIQIGSGEGILNSYSILETSYDYFGKKLSDFIPPGKSEEYIKGFKAQFKQMSGQMFDAAKKYRNEAIRTISKNEILSNQNFSFQNNSHPIKFYGNGVLMDRGGVK